MRVLVAIALLSSSGCFIDVPTFTTGEDDIDGGTDGGGVPDADCAGFCDAYCLRGTVTVTDAFDVVNGNPSTMAFEHLEGTTIDYRMIFEVTDQSVVVGDGTNRPAGQLRILTTGPLTFAFSDIFMNDTFGAAYRTGGPYEITLVNNGTEVGVYLGNLVSPSGVEYWGWEVLQPTDCPLQIGTDGFPALAPSTGAGDLGNLILRRYQAGTPQMTDYAQSTWTVALDRGAGCL